MILCSLLQPGSAPEKTAHRTLKVKLRHTGSGTIDEKHKILVFLFDSPAFIERDVMPLAMRSATSKNETVTFADAAKSPGYIGAIYDTTGSNMP